MLRSMTQVGESLFLLCAGQCGDNEPNTPSGHTTMLSTKHIWDKTTECSSMPLDGWMDGFKYARILPIVQLSGMGKLKPMLKISEEIVVLQAYICGNDK